MSDKARGLAMIGLALFAVLTPNVGHWLVFSAIAIGGGTFLLLGRTPKRKGPKMANADDEMVPITAEKGADVLLRLDGETECRVIGTVMVPMDIYLDSKGKTVGVSVNRAELQKRMGGME